MTSTVVKRPSGVTLVSVFVVISGVLYVILGLVAGIAATGTSNEPTGGQATALIPGIAILVLGLVELAVARGIFRGSNGARVIVAIVNALTIVAGFFAAVGLGSQVGTSIGPVIIAIIVLVLLYSRSANEFFARSRATLV